MPRMPNPPGLVMVLLFTWMVATPVEFARPAGPSSNCTAMPADPAYNPDLGRCHWLINSLILRCTIDYSPRGKRWATNSALARRR
jgi:hypothetical protein